MDLEMPKNLKRAKFVRKQREERAWPQSQLADIAGVNLRTIQRLEKNGAASYETLQGVAQALEVDVKELSPASSEKKGEIKQKNVYQLPRLLSGKEVAKLFWGADQYQIEHDDVGSKDELNLMIKILDELQRDVVRWHDGDLSQKLKIEFGLSQGIKALEKFGFYLFGLKRMVPKNHKTPKNMITVCTIYMSHTNSPKIVKDKKSNMTIPALLSEFAQ